jgi:hypothetical protein
MLRCEDNMYTEGCTVLVNLLLLVDRELTGPHVDKEEETATTNLSAIDQCKVGVRNLHNREDLEEVVLRKVLVRVVRVQSPPVVDVEVEDAEDKHQHNSRKLGLKANNNHDAGNESEQASHDSPKAPVATEDEANEEEDEQNTPGKLEVHLLVLLVKLGKTGRSELLTNPGVRKNHHETSHNREVA